MSQQEQEANWFATAILMPLELVRREYAEVSAKYPDIERIVEEMAKRFQVSEARMAVRIGEMQTQSLST